MTTADIRARFPAITIDTDITEPYMDEVLVEVEQRGLLDQFLSDLERLLDGGLRRVELYKDFAPLSFTFRWFLQNRAGEWEPWLFGGFIFHDAGTTGFGAPTFSGLLTPVETSRWATHT
jgi:hypothetical protein